MLIISLTIKFLFSEKHFSTPGALLVSFPSWFSKCLDLFTFVVVVCLLDSIVDLGVLVLRFDLSGRFACGLETVFSFSRLLLFPSRLLDIGRVFLVLNESPVLFGLPFH